MRWSCYISHRCRLAAADPMLVVHDLLGRGWIVKRVWRRSLSVHLLISHYSEIRELLAGNFVAKKIAWIQKPSVLGAPSTVHLLLHLRLHSLLLHLLSHLLDASMKLNFIQLPVDLGLELRSDHGLPLRRRQLIGESEQQLILVPLSPLAQLPQRIL